MVGRIVGDLQLAFRRLATLPACAPQLVACRRPAADLVDGAAHLRRFYARREYERACAVIERMLAPRVRMFFSLLQEDAQKER